jgi:cytochrome c oxidase subunit II
VPPRRIAHRRALAALRLLPALVLAAAACGGTYGAPEAASEEGEEVLQMWRVLLFTAGAFALVVFGLLAWALVRYRARAAAKGEGHREGEGERGGDHEDLPVQTHGNGVLEAVYVAVPALVVALLFAYILHVEDVAVGDGPADVVVEVTSFRWGWLFEYAPEVGSEEPVVVSVASEPGRLPELVVPVDATVRFDLHTSDVIHSFWVPALLTKQDTLPGEERSLQVRLTRTGRFRGHCAEYCGLDHARMDFTLVVVTAAEFEDWLAEHQGTAA